MKTILFSFLTLLSVDCTAQYLGIKARYTETRLVDDSPRPPKRENRLILSFYEVSSTGVYTPTSLSNFPLWVYKQGLQYGSQLGGVLDSAGNNYPGYDWPAPKVVSYYNSYGPNSIDCDPNAATPYTVNGHQLDCGFVTVSYWDFDGGTGQLFEAFPAPNVCLPYYFPPEQYALAPGNLNFEWPLPPTAPYNWYSFTCSSSTQQLIIRGVIGFDSASSAVTLPVRFAHVRAVIDPADQVKIFWSNLTESDIDRYEMEQSLDGSSFLPLGTVMPVGNNGSRADYVFSTPQSEARAFYRIKAVENNGSTFYTIVVPVSRSLTSTNTQRNLLVYPNPVTGETFSFRLANAEAGRYLSSIVTPSGQHLKYKMINHNGGNLTRQINMADLPPGLYQLVLRGPTQRYSKQIVYVH